MKQGQSSVLEEAIKPGTAGKGAGRFYMNKIFGRGLEKARALEEQMKEAGKPGAILRAMIEPGRAGDGHRVVIERRAVTIQGGMGANPVRNSEHTFGQIEDAIRFLDDVLHGRLPGENDEKDDNGKGGNTTGDATGDGMQDAGEADDFSSGRQPSNSGEEW